MSTQSLTAPRGLPEIGRSLGRAFSNIPRWLLIALAALVIVGLIAGTVISRTQSATQVVTAPVVRQTLTQSVTASGTVNAQNSVTVGSQVSGTISQLYADYNSKVKQGQVLARIDPSNFQAQLAKDEAALAQAQAQAGEAAANANGAGAGVTVAQANANAQEAAANAAKTNIAKAQSALTLAQQQLARDQQLLAQGYIAQATVQSGSVDGRARRIGRSPGTSRLRASASASAGEQRNDRTKRFDRASASRKRRRCASRRASRGSHRANG